MTKEHKTICRDILNHYGIQNQTVIAVEELSELQKEICKGFRNARNRDNIVEEIADTQIVTEQIKQHYGISDAEINRVVSAKLERQQQRIEQGL